MTTVQYMAGEDIDAGMAVTIGPDGKAYRAGQSDRWFTAPANVRRGELWRHKAP